MAIFTKNLSSVTKRWCIASKFSKVYFGHYGVSLHFKRVNLLKSSYLEEGYEIREVDALQWLHHEIWTLKHPSVELNIPQCKLEFYMRPSFSTRLFSISSLFFTIKAYLLTKFMSEIASSLHLSDVFPLFLSYKHEKGTKVPFVLHSQPWAALNAAPRDAESVKGVKGTNLLTYNDVIHQEKLTFRSRILVF